MELENNDQTKEYTVFNPILSVNLKITFSPTHRWRMLPCLNLELYKKAKFRYIRMNVTYDRLSEAEVNEKLKNIAKMRNLFPI